MNLPPEDLAAIEVGLHLERLLVPSPCPLADQVGCDTPPGRCAYPDECARPDPTLDLERLSQLLLAIYRAGSMGGPPAPGYVDLVDAALAVVQATAESPSTPVERIHARAAAVCVRDEIARLRRVEESAHVVFAALGLRRAGTEATQ